MRKVVLIVVGAIIAIMGILTLFPMMTLIKVLKSLIGQNL